MKTEIPANQMPHQILYGEQAMEQLDSIYKQVKAKIEEGIGIAIATNTFQFDREVHHIMMYQLPAVKMPAAGSAAPHPKPKS